MRKTEILSPAGDMECVRAAVANGCDAVYLGGRDFNARSGAQNFSDAELDEVIDYCHCRGVKTYITVNTLYKDIEMKAVYDFIVRMYMSGADAFIVQDAGAAAFIARNLPGVRLHASTQMTAHSVNDVLLLESAGFHRVVLSRELAMDEITAIAERGAMEAEVFVHGALCVSYSGRCLMSSMLGGRSGNRGRCAQPCRLRYELVKDDKTVADGYLLSPKDMAAYDSIPRLMSSGVAALKLEGRMKGPEYVAVITRLYRNRVDSILSGEPDGPGDPVSDAAQIFSRGGGFTGYHSQYAGRGMMSEKTPKSTGLRTGIVTGYDARSKLCVFKTDIPLVPGDGIEIWTSSEPHPGCGINKRYTQREKVSVYIDGSIKNGDQVYKSFDKRLSDEARKSYEKDIRKLRTEGRLYAHADEAVKMELSCGNVSVAEEGAVTRRADKTPTSRERILEQAAKSGNTSFDIVFGDIDIDDDIFIQVSEINALRRKCTEALQDALVMSYKKERPEIVQKMTQKENNPPLEVRGDTERNTREKWLNINVNDAGQLRAAMIGGVHTIYLEARSGYLPLVEHYAPQCREKGIKLYVALPHISRDTEQGRLETLLMDIETSGADGFLVRTLGQLQLLSETKKELALDYTFNIFNTASFDFYMPRGNIKTAALSPELNVSELPPVSDAEIIIYGRLPMMTTVQCPVGNFASGRASGQYCKMGGQQDEYFLKDRKGYMFPIKTDCADCTAFIMNAHKIYALNKMDAISRLAPRYVRFMFTDEDAGYVERLVSSYVNDDTEAMRTLSTDKSTYGHLFRGVL